MSKIALRYQCQIYVPTDRASDLIDFLREKGYDPRLELFVFKDAKTEETINVLTLPVCNWPPKCITFEELRFYLDEFEG